MLRNDTTFESNRHTDDRTQYGNTQLPLRGALAEESKNSLSSGLKNYVDYWQSYRYVYFALRYGSNLQMCEGGSAKNCSRSTKLSSHTQVCWCYTSLHRDARESLSTVSGFKNKPDKHTSRMIWWSRLGTGKPTRKMSLQFSIKSHFLRSYTHTFCSSWKTLPVKFCRAAGLQLPFGSRYIHVNRAIPHSRMPKRLAK